MLEREFRFTRSWIRTDYEFPTQAEGERLVGLFFGEAMAQSFASSGQRTLPECTGLWTR
ncbi:MAG TPA: hypothetical protein VJR89_15385 [Polyangiales bacterium]|nr:hypothetical protein [Polyangiales bacterium]